jgi:hypothetical protein
MVIGSDAAQGGMFGQVVNGWAASINALIDGFSEIDPSKEFSFGEAFDKYSEAGIDGMDELSENASQLPGFAEMFAEAMDEAAKNGLKTIDQIQAAIDAINEEARQETIRQNDEAAAIEADAKEEQEKQNKTPAGEIGESLVNDYQRRGLSLDASGSGNLANRTNKAVESILSLLIKNFRVTREPVF